MLRIIFIIFVLALVNCIHCEFNLTIVHISDFHSHWFEFDENKHDCSKQESKEGKCYGGFPRLLSFIRDIKQTEKNVLVLSSGEFFLGRSLHALHGWKLAHALLPRLDLDAMCLSNHDFDSGIFELSAFLYAMKFPVLCANMWARNGSFLYSRVNKSVVIDVGGEKIGIVGYIHRHALKKTKNAASVKFLPEIPALQDEVQRLENEGVNKIIALGHAGYYTDLEIAKNVKGVDIVIGGDSDIMLTDPGPDANESSKVGNIHGNYPRVHHHEPEENDAIQLNRTLVLHIPQHGMFVGVLRATFDDKGKIISESGEPVLLDSTIPQDEDTLEFMEFAQGALEDLSRHSRLPEDAELLGKIEKHLDGNPRNCRMRECSLGNFIADAMLYEFTFYYRNNTGRRYDYEHWGPIDALVINSGAIKRSIEPGYIRISDILKSVSLGGFIERSYMSGKQIMEMMEHSVKHYDPFGVTPPGAFLQISGLKVEYDLSQPPGKRVRSLFIRCRDCGDDNTYFPVKFYKTYVIGMPNFLKTGRDGFYDFEEHNMEDMGQFDALLIVEYLRRMFDIEPILDGRIKFFEPEKMDSNRVPPLLFGEPLPVVGSEPNLHNDKIHEHAAKTSPEGTMSNETIDDESKDILANLHAESISENASLFGTASNRSINNVSEKNSAISNFINPSTTLSKDTTYNEIKSDESVNNSPNASSDSRSEVVSATISKDVSSNQRINYELTNKSEKDSEIKNSVHLLSELENSLEIQQSSSKNKRSEPDSILQRTDNNVEFAERENKSNSQVENDIIALILHSVALPDAIGKNVSESQAFLRNKIGYALQQENNAHTVLHSTEENLSILKKLTDIVSGLLGNAIQSDVVSDLKKRLIAKRSLLESLKNDGNNTELVDYMNFMETYLRALFNDVIPVANSSTEGASDMRNAVPKGSEETFTEGKTVKTSAEVDFRESVIQVLKRILGKDNLKKLSKFFINFSPKTNASVTDEYPL